MKIFSPVFFCLFFGVGFAHAEADVDFARQVLPILSDKCFLCHGPDAKKGDLRLDSFAGATENRDGVQAIDPNEPVNSEALDRLFDSEDPMPPSDAEKQLSETERNLLKRWIMQGGQYARHWAFVPPRKSDSGDSIDDFVSAGHKRSGVDFGPEADRPTLARRAALTLTGLPPEPDQLSTFLNDSSDNAYERLVESLLASPHYGEHQARYWLDAIRYGDTHGLHLDNRRAIYPFRDWVVRALNRNMPLDQFLTEQLAGDLLPNPSMDQLIATGFVRMNPTTAEGGVIPAEFQAKNNFDRTETLGTVLLGMTLNCARCHTHKYDPIPQKEYFQLLAFFNSTAENPLDGNAYHYAPTLEVPPDQPSWERWHKIRTERDNILSQAKLEKEKFSEVQKFAKSLQGWKTSDWKASGMLDLKTEAPATDDKSWKPFGGLPGTARDKLPAAHQARWITAEISAPSDQQVWMLFAGGPDSAVWLNDQPLTLMSAERESHTVSLPLVKGEQTLRIKLAGMAERPKIRVEFRSPWEQLAKTASWEQAEADDRLLALADAQGPLQSHPQHAAASKLANLLISARTGFVLTLIAKELPKPRETKILARGEYQLPTGDPLAPGVFSVMGELPADAPPNRLGLARWLVSRDNPLVSRVLINRAWQRTFGHGLVRTPEDFGLQGEQPTHPELLDWLAVELQDSGWDLKHMLRLMVTSRTFRQDSAWRQSANDPENRLYARGPSYRLDAEVIRDIGLWASGLLDPHMGGEGIKPPQPPGMWSALMHPASNTKLYVPDSGQRLYRRSLYMYWKRTSPHPMMTLFNAPDRESSCVRRDRASTPLQSLGLFNENQRLEMGRALAEGLLKGEKDNGNRLDSLFVKLACRPPNIRERQVCERLLAAMRERYKKTPDEAKELLRSAGVSEQNSVPQEELAAWMQLAITVLASDVSIILF